VVQTHPKPGVAGTGCPDSRLLRWEWREPAPANLGHQVGFEATEIDGDDGAPLTIVADYPAPVNADIKSVEVILAPDTDPHRSSWHQGDSRSCPCGQRRRLPVRFTLRLKSGFVNCRSASKHCWHERERVHRSNSKSRPQVRKSSNTF